jgi:hypothetical protein
MWENYSYGTAIYMGDVHRPKQVKDTCMKTLHAGTMDRGFTVLVSAV